LPDFDERAKDIGRETLSRRECSEHRAAPDKRFEVTIESLGEIGNDLVCEPLLVPDPLEELFGEWLDSQGRELCE
jgi:hypothetical protein